MERAVNPQTGEVLFLVNNQWVPPSQVAKNDQGDMAYLVGNKWEVVGANKGLASLAKPDQAFDPLGQAIGDIPKPMDYEVEGKGKMNEPGAFTTLADLAKQFIAPGLKAPFALPLATETAIKGFARQAMEGNPEALMPSSVYQPGLDTEETLFGPETEEQKARRKLQAQRAVAAMPSIPGAKALNKIGEDVQKDIQNSLSDEAKKALKESQLTGNIFKGEVDFGTNPTAYGYALQASNVFGSMAPVIATAMVTKSPGVGGFVGGTMAADEAATNAAEYINKMPDAELLKKSPFYAQMISGGASPQEARELTIKKAAESGAALQGLVATFGDVLTGKLVTGAFDKAIAKLGTNRLARGVGVGAASGLEESLQETGEGVASDVAIKNVVPSKELGEDSAGNFLLGFIGGAGPGVVKGALTKGEAREPEREKYVKPEGGLAELIARQKGFLTPEGAPRRQAPAAKPVVSAEPVAPPPSASQDTEAMLREILGEAPKPQLEEPSEQPPSTQLAKEVLPDTNTVSVEKPAEVPAFKAPAGFAYSVTQSPAYEGVEPLSADDAQFELETLLESAKRGRMTPERFAQSEIGRRLGTGQVMVINDGIKTNPIATIEALMQKIAPAEQPAPTKSVEEVLPQAPKAELDAQQVKGMTDEQLKVQINNISLRDREYELVKAEIENRKQEPASTKPAEEALPKEAEPTLKEQYDKAAKLNFMAPDAFRDKRITQEQYDQIKSDYERIKAQYQASIPKTELSPIQQEATDIADKLEALGQKPFANGMRTAIEKNQVSEKNMEFYRNKLKQEQAKQNTLEEGVERPSEKWSWSTFYGDDTKGLEKLNLFNSKASPEAKQALQTISDSIQAVTDRLNDEGYAMRGTPDSTTPKEIRDLRSQIQMRSAEGSLLINKFEALNKGFNRSKKTTNQENLDQAIKDAKAGAAEAQKSLQRSIPEPEEVVNARAEMAEANKRIENLQYKSGSLWAALRGKLDPEEVREIFGRNPNLGQKKLQVTKKSGQRGTYISEMADDGLLDQFLPIDMRRESSRFDAAEASQYIKDLVANQDYLPFDVKKEIEDIEKAYGPVGDLIDEYLTIKEQNRELQIAADEQREADQAAEIVEPEGENRPVERGKGQAGELELTAPTADEIRAKQDEIDRLTKENERLAKAAEAKAKADEQAQDFVLTGSNREADQAAARGQKDIFGETIEEAPAKPKAKEAPLSLEYTKALDESRDATKEFSKAQEAYRAQKIDDDEFLIARKKYDLAIAQFDQAFKKEQNKPAKKAEPEVAEEVKAEEPSYEVHTPDGNTLTYPAAYGLVNNGYKVLALDDPRTYVDNGGNAKRTFEKDGVRLSLSPQIVIFQDKNRVLLARGNEEDVTLEAILVDSKDRGQGKASQALKDLADIADKNGLVLYAEPTPLKDKKTNQAGLDFDQLVKLYKKFGFDFAVYYNGPSTKVMERAPNAEFEVLPAKEPQIAGQLENEPYTFEGQFTEIGDEEQRTLITDQSSKLSDAQINTLEKEYGAKNGSDEFFEALRKDVIAYVTQGAKAVSGKIRAIIRQMANGLLSVAIVFNPQFVSQPYTIAVPQYDIRTSEVVKDLPKEAQSMSDAAKRAYGVIYPTLEAELKEKNKLFIVADKQSANTYIFQPDGSLLLQSKTLFGAGIGDFMKGDNNIVANRITPAGLFDLGMRDAKRSASEEYMYGDYDFGKVFVLDKSYMGRNGPYSQLVMHSVWTNEKDAKQRLAALDKPGAEDSRYSFGCINVNKETFRNLITNHLGQMDGAKIFIVPENGSNVMDFVNGKATYSEDIIRQRVTPVTKTTKIEKQRAAPKVEERTLVAKEEEPGQFMSIEPQTKTQAFKKFFGDSKVVNEDGSPMVVYHGTIVRPDTGDVKNMGNIMAFDRLFTTQFRAPSIDTVGSFFTTNPGKGGAEMYSGAGEGAAIYPVYLSIKNPYTTTFETMLRRARMMENGVDDGRKIGAKEVEALRKFLKESGKDGIHIKADPKSAEFKDQDVWIALEPEQIKSATGNRGTFDESGNINMNLGDSLVKLVDQMADGLAEDEKKRSPSFKRQAKTLTNQRNQGKLTEEEFLERMNAAIAEDEDRRLGADIVPRKRGYLLIQEKMSAAVRRGDLSREAYDLANWFMQQNEALVDDLGISIKGKGPLGAGGFYNNLSRIITLIKEGSSDLTATHEILHHLERMMPTKIQQAIRKAWLSQLTKAQKTAKSPASKLYFAALMDAHFGANDPTLLNIPEGAGNEYAAARSNMEDSGKKTSMELAKQLLLLEFVPIEAYQYFDPSEFWAVNATDIVKARYDAVKGGVLAKLKNWLREFGQKVKSAFGLNSDASIIRALDSLAKSDGKFVTDNMLVQGEYQNISKNFRGDEMPQATWAMKESSILDDMAQKWQDNFRDLKNVQKVITETIGKIDDRLNAYRKQTLNPGREGERQLEFVKYEVDPLIKEMLANNVSNKELATYLHNRYAEERNEIINAKNKSPAVQDQGSGIKTEKAREYLDKLPEDRKQVLESLANQIDEIVRGTQDILVESGQEKQETINGWRNESPHYVPLSRDESELDFIVQTGGGNLGGYATAGKFGKEAMGSTKTVVNILENVMLQRDRAIRRAESIRIGQALYGMAIQYPNPNFWMAINPDAIKDKDALIAEMESFGLDEELIENLLEEPKTAFATKTKGPNGETIRDVKYRVNRSYQNARNVFPIRINGQNRFVLFNPRSPEAIRLAAELKALDPEQLNLFFGAASSFSRWFGAMNTQYNPVFGILNVMLDFQDALLNLSTTPLAGQQYAVTKNILPAMWGIARDIRKERKQTEKTPIKTAYGKEIDSTDWTNLWRLYRNAGGKTSFRQQMVKPKLNVEWKGLMPNFSYTDEHVMLEALEKLEKGPIGKQVEWWANAFSDFNDTLENTTRLAVFKVAYIDNKFSVEEAAEIAKNITVDFNRRGAKTKNIRGMYVFFNASLQSNARQAITLAGPAGKTIIKYGLAMGALNAFWMLMAGFDDDDPPQFVKNKGFIIPTGGGDFFIWNLPQGWRAIPNMGRLISEGTFISLGLMKSNKGMAGKISDAGSVFLDAINPFGGGTLLQTISPTFFDPIAAIIENKDSFGRPISKEDQSLKPKPGWQRTRENASEFSKNLAWFLNYISAGGEEFDKGFISPTGDQLDYLIGQVSGGFARDVKRAGELISNTAEGEKTPPYRKPILNRFIGETKTDAAISSRFYDNVTMLAGHLNNINGRIENNRDVQGYMNKNPISKLAFASEDFEKDVSSINQDITALQKMEQTPERKAQIKQLKETRIKIMTIFNDLVRQAQ